MDCPEMLVVVGTWALVLVTCALVLVTWLLGRRQIQGQLSVAREQLRMQFFLELRKQFDGPLVSERKLLAQKLKSDAPHDEINEPVLDFLEDLGMLVRRDYVDREMVWDTFSYYVKGWWGACKDYITQERLDKGGDTTLFTDFGTLVEIMYADEMKKRGEPRIALEPSAATIKRFLDGEACL
jgi:hypothetical protein